MALPENSTARGVHYPGVVEPQVLFIDPGTNLPMDQIKRTLAGIKSAILKDKDDAEKNRVENIMGRISEWLQEDMSFSVKDLWLSAQQKFAGQEDSHLIANLLIGIAYIRQKKGDSAKLQVTHSLNFIWPIIYAAVSGTGLFKSYRSAAGFIYVPLCSLLNPVQDAKGKTQMRIDELWRLHVWLPDGNRGTKGFEPHMHNTNTISWILAGDGENLSWNVERNADKENASHTEYTVNFSDGKTSDVSYKPHQTESVVYASSKYARAKISHTEPLSRNMTYTVTRDQWHSSHVPPGAVFATLFFFDGSPGYNEDAPILGPIHGEKNVQSKDPGDNAPEKMVNVVEDRRQKEQADEE